MNLNRITQTFIVAAAAVFSSHANAIPSSVTPLLIINDSNPAAVTITATDYNPFLFRNDSSHSFDDGIDLANFFVVPSDITDLQDLDFSGTGNLSTSVDTTPSYDNAESDDFTGGYQDLSLYKAFATAIEHFDINDPAFTGTETYDLRAEAAYLPPAKTVGAIFTGYSGDLGDLSPPPPIQDELSLAAILGADSLLYIGDYEVIPEPSTWAMLIVGGAGLFALRRLRQA